MIRPLFAFALVAMPLSAGAQERIEGTPPQRIRNVQLLPGEKCPVAQSDEIVVCGAVKDQFRIPETLREPPNPAGNQSWAARADAAMEDNRKVLPGSCSPIGSNGHTGCAQKAAEEWAAEKRAAANGQTPR